MRVIHAATRQKFIWLLLRTINCRQRHFATMEVVCLSLILTFEAIKCGFHVASCLGANYEVHTILV